LTYTRRIAYSAICAFLAGADPTHEAKLLNLFDDFIYWTQGMSDFFIPEWFPFSPFGNAMKSRARIIGVMNSIIKERRQRMEEEGEIFKDALGLFMEAEDENGNKFTDAEIADNFIVLGFAGYDTSSNVMASCMHFLTMPESEGGISEKELELLLEELRDPELDLETGDSQLLNLPRLDAFLKEVFRLATPVPGSFRLVTEDSELNGVPVKKGTILTVSLVPRTDGIEDPEKFKYARFLDTCEDNPEGALDKRMPMAFTPFGAGPRMCLGFQLAKLEVSTESFNMAFYNISSRL
jgi:cytochrome P450